MINYELAKQLKDAGFPQYGGLKFVSPEKEPWDETMQSDYETSRIPSRDGWVKSPTLSELLEACGDRFDSLLKDSEGDGWNAHAQSFEAYDLLVSGGGSTPEEAVARLWLELNKK